MLRHADTVTVGFAMDAHLIRRLDAVAATLGLGRPEAIHAAIVHWLDEEERRKTAQRDRMLKVRARMSDDANTA